MINEELQPLVEAGDETAREQMITQNMHLCKKIVRDFLTQRPQYKYLSEDLVSGAYVGLVMAVNKMVGHKNKNALAFMSFWITEEIGKAIEDEQPIRIPHRSRRRNSLQTPPRVAIDLDKIECEGNTFDTREEILDCCSCPEEEQIVRLRANGLKDDEIANQIGLSKYTVFMQRQAIYERYQRRQ